MTEYAAGSFRFFPIVAGSVEFAAALRREILAARPDVVALPLWRALEAPLLTAVARLPELSAIGYAASGDAEEDEAYCIVEPCDPLVEAVRSARETGARIEFLFETPPYPAQPFAITRHASGSALPDPYAAARVSVEAYVGAALASGALPAEDPAIVGALAHALQGADPTLDTLVVVPLTALPALLQAMDRPAPEPEAEAPAARGQLRVVNLHPECLAEICRTPPYYAQRYERWREAAGAPEPERLRWQMELLREAEVNYRAQANETLASWQRRQLARFSRKLAASAGVLLQDLFDLVSAARGIADDNYAWELWHAAGEWPWQREASELETVRLRCEDLAPGVRRMQLRKRPLREKRLRLPRGLKDRPKERYPGEWAEQIDGESICSYPPEDLVIEEYGRRLRQNARSMLSEERTQTERFTTSLLDGIDVRETIRNWHRGEIWVRHAEQQRGDVGAVVVIFDEDLEDRFNYETTWLGEHQNESDMAFYSTPPFEHMIGPGIGRAEYGGFLMILPSRRMFDVWGDADYDMAETKAERLLLAGLDYSLERHVVYAAAKPPRSVFRTIAARMGRSIVYVPLGQLSPQRLKQIRVVHVLDSRARRREAKEYLW
jgi:hypothetical protein